MLKRFQDIRNQRKSPSVSKLRQVVREKPIELDDIDVKVDYFKKPLIKAQTVYDFNKNFNNREMTFYNLKNPPLPPVDIPILYPARNRNDEVYNYIQTIDYNNQLLSRKNREEDLEKKKKELKNAADITGANFGLTLLESMGMPRDLTMGEIAPYLQPSKTDKPIYFESGSLNYPTDVPAYNSNMSMYFPAGSVANLGLS